MSVICSILTSFGSNILTTSLISSLNENTESQLEKIPAIKQAILQYGNYLKLTSDDVSSCYTEIVFNQYIKIIKDKKKTSNSIFENEGVICNLVGKSMNEITSMCKSNSAHWNSFEAILGLTSNFTGLGVLKLKKELFNSNEKKVHEMFKLLISTIHFVRNNQMESELFYYTKNLERNI